ncbi:GLPGLI family protein [Neptunitalea lumnitzerae]|nr:GLPGLI family protein [Neptunitalea sp. Y10]
MKFICLLFVLLVQCCFSQQGEATYFEHVQMQFQLDSSSNAQMNDAMKDKIRAQIQSQMQKEYTLVFNTKESVYKQEAKLNTPNPAAQNGGVFVMTAGGSDILYKNLQTHSFANQTELMGKVFLIKDTLSTRQWQLGTETKTIGNYTCYKATATYTQEHQKINFSNTKELTEHTTETITITAWYTPEIAISNGPENYQGLPGLILEIHDGSKTLVCNKVTLSNKKDIEIEAPTKGKEVTQTEFDEISDKKMKQWVEQHTKKTRNGNEITIEISK